ncbi:MAG: hypothetical protein WC710_13470 [Gallionella sp.]|jgi:hypothetical protein
MSHKGGKREGSGRKPTGMKRHNVMLDETTTRNARKLGTGCLSKGIRNAVEKVCK